VCVGSAVVFEAALTRARRLPAPGRRARRMALVAGVAVVAAGAVYTAQALGDFTHPPATAASSGQGDSLEGHLLSGSGSGRWQFWTSALDEFRSSPLHGGGPGSFEAWWAEHGSFRYLVKDAHSLF